jgi:ATP-binding cassette subfamily B protein
MENLTYIISYASPFIKKYRLSIILTFSFVFIGRTLGLAVIPVFYKQLIDMIGVGSSTFQELLSVFLLIVVSQLLVKGILRFNEYLIAKTQAKLVFDMNEAAYKTISAQSYRFFTNSFVGSLVSKLSKFGRAFYTIYDILLWQFVGTIGVLIVIIGIVFSENIILGIVFLVWSLIYFSSSFLFVKKQSLYDVIRAKTTSALSGTSSDIFSNIINVKSFSSFNRELRIFNKVNTKSYRARLKSWFYMNKVNIIMNIFQLVFELGVILLSLYLWSTDMISTGTIVLVLLYITRVIDQLWFLSGSIRRLTTSISDCVEVIEILNLPNDVVDILNPEDVSIDRGDIEFDEISFTYPDGDHVFEFFNLTIPQGQSVGLVGRSGSGKTTVTKLLLRFFDVDSGAIRIDNQNIASVTQDDLRSRISYIPQESILFHRSIYENIAYGNPEASKEEVVEAAKFAHAHEFITQFEDGYETRVGERGVKLSGGQKQRIAIARAMLKKEAPILLMDEATSSLDSLSERYIQESFEQLMKNRTTLVIAHRLSTIQKMDRIIVLDKGKIIEDGSHKDLIKKNGYYKKLWDSQVDGIIVD